MLHSVYILLRGILQGIKMEALTMNGFFEYSASNDIGRIKLWQEKA